MPLLDFWKDSKQTVLGLSIAQIVGIAGDIGFDGIWKGNDFSFAIPYVQMEAYRQEMYATGAGNRQYWHVLMREDDDGHVFLKLPERGIEAAD